MADKHERASGYLTSALAFAGVTALWAWLVRDDPYYAMTELFGFNLPVATVFYLTLMPLAGLVVGRWRYDESGAKGVAAYLMKSLARSAHFFYSHLLIVLFTAAMLADKFLGLNIDESVRQIDDSLFDIASRFAPWLAAYLAGYNLGRATRAG